jgi:hypothetical protein
MFHYRIAILHAKSFLLQSLVTSIDTVYTGYPRKNVPDFGRVFLMLKYTDIIPKHLYPKLNGYGDNGERSLRL